MIGTKLAHYEITSHIGSGGMGDVYKPSIRSWTVVSLLSFFLKRSATIPIVLHDSSVKHGYWHR